MARLLSVDTETVKKKPPKKRPSVSSSASTAKKSTSSSKKSSISALVKDDGHKSSITRQSSKRTEQQSESQASQASKRSKSQQPSKKFFSNVALSPSTACQSSVQQESSEKHCVSLNKLRQTEIRLDLDSETKSVIVIHCSMVYFGWFVVRIIWTTTARIKNYAIRFSSYFHLIRAALKPRAHLYPPLLCWWLWHCS